jgi:hypothetical protein
MFRKMSQLSLFPNTLRQEKLIQQAEGLTITVYIVCQNCKRVVKIDPHIPIHSKEYMDKNWIFIGNNNYEVIAKDCTKCTVIKL